MEICINCSNDFLMFIKCVWLKWVIMSDKIRFEGSLKAKTLKVTKIVNTFCILMTYLWLQSDCTQSELGINICNFTLIVVVFICNDHQILVCNHLTIWYIIKFHILLTIRKRFCYILTTLINCINKLNSSYQNGLKSVISSQDSLSYLCVLSIQLAVFQYIKKEDTNRFKVSQMIQKVVKPVINSFWCISVISTSNQMSFIKCVYICGILKLISSSDGWAFTNNIDIHQHQSLTDRLAAAQILVEKDPLCPVVVDEMSNVSAIKYGALPDRFYVLQAGKVVYKVRPVHRWHQEEYCVSRFRVHKEE